MVCIVYFKSDRNQGNYFSSGGIYSIWCAQFIPNQTEIRVILSILEEYILYQKFKALRALLSGGIQISFLGVYNSTGGIQLSFQGIYNSTGGIQISFLKNRRIESCIKDSLLEKHILNVTAEKGRTGSAWLETGAIKVTIQE